MVSVLLAVYLATVAPSPRPARAGVDSIDAERLVQTMPRRVPMHKEREISGSGVLFAATAKHVQDLGFFDWTQARIEEVCGKVGNVNRLSLRVHDDTGWRQIVIPDGCHPASIELDGQLANLRDLTWAVLEYGGRG
ncbi:MAG TPA: hypothetical protein VGM67_08570 [Gemmatimonadaceae bacterium]|jgi:hypothetical protein